MPNLKTFKGNKEKLNNYMAGWRRDNRAKLRKYNRDWARKKREKKEKLSTLALCN